MESTLNQKVVSKTRFGNGAYSFLYNIYWLEKNGLWKSETSPETNDFYKIQVTTDDTSLRPSRIELLEAFSSVKVRMLEIS